MPVPQTQAAGATPWRVSWLCLFVAEPEMCDFRKMFEGVLPCALQGVKPWGAATSAARHPGAFEQVTPGTQQSSALKAG